MLDNDIGPAFLIVLGLAFALYGLGQLVQAYRLEQLGEWMAKVLPVRQGGGGQGRERVERGGVERFVIRQACEIAEQLTEAP